MSGQSVYSKFLLLVIKHYSLSDFLVFELRVLVSEILVGHLLLKGGFEVVKLDPTYSFAIFI